MLVQVNTSGESTKFGAAPESTPALVQDIAALGSLRIRGLMTIGLFSSDGDATRRCFVRLRELRDEIAAEDIPGVELDHLSMGMSLDFEAAIEEGATIVRIGRSVFGPRPSMLQHYWNESAQQT